MKKNLKINIIVILIVFTVVLISVGYSAFGTTLNITGAVAQVRLQTELGQVQDVNPIVAKKAEVGIKNINLIRNKLAGHYKTDRISEE